MNIDSIIKLFIGILIEKNKFSYFTIIRYRYKFILDYFRRKFKKLDQHPLSEYCYWLMHDINDFPKCKKVDKYGNICNNRRKFLNIIDGYQDYCSLLCMQQSIFSERKRIETNIKKPVILIKLKAKKSRIKYRIHVQLIKRKMITILKKSNRK